LIQGVLKGYKFPERIIIMGLGWFGITILIGLALKVLNYFKFINNLMYILITAGFLIIGFILGILLQGAYEKDDNLAGFGFKMLFIGIVMLVLYFIF
jgi:hypothetical protein